jgi:hypothetical protein
MTPDISAIEARAAFVLEGFEELQRVRGCVSRITVADVVLLLSLGPPDPANDQLAQRADAAETQYVQLGALVIAAIAKHDMEHGESCDCYAAILLEPLDTLLLQVAPVNVRHEPAQTDGSGPLDHIAP